MGVAEFSLDEFIEDESEKALFLEAEPEADSWWYSLFKQYWSTVFGAAKNVFRIIILLF